MNLWFFVPLTIAGFFIFIWITTITTPTRFVIYTFAIIGFLMCTIYRSRDKIPPYAYYVIDRVQPCLMNEHIGQMHYIKISNFQHDDCYSRNAFLIDSISVYRVGDTIVMLDTYIQGYPEYWKKGLYDVSKFEWILPR